MVTAAGTRPVRLLDNPGLLRERLRATPDSPGVYLMRDMAARVAYVGKATSLRSRLRSYFSGVESHPDRTRRLVERIFDFEVVACQNGREALILENSLIKRYRPRFNIRLKDDKSYLYLKIPQPGAPDTHAPGTAREGTRKARSERAGRATNYPRPYYTRRLARDGARYFGPYTSASSLRTTVRSLRTIFPFRTCSDEVFARGRVCLDFHIKRCAGPCEERIDEPSYARLLNEVSMFMDGRSQVLTGELHEQMGEASARLDFEAAARYRDRLRAVDRINERQRMLQGARADEDCVAVSVDGGRAMVAMLFARGGRVVGMETHELEGAGDRGPSECLAAFVTQYYGSAPLIPRTVLLSDSIEDVPAVAAFLSEQRGARVALRVPRRGPARQLLDQARDTAANALRQARVVEDFDSDRADLLLADLQAQLDLPSTPERIECYDISNTMGTNSVGSMVVFERGRPKPAHYRHFGIKTVEGANDFASMQETLRRRFGRHRAAVEAATGADVPVDDPDGSNGGEHRRRAPHDDSFGVLPDLIIIDGGKGQLSAARETLVDAGLGALAVFGLAKRNEELHRPGIEEPVVLARDSPTLFLVQRVRDEAHRFAITHHRARRAKAALTSKLDIVPGLGPVRRRALLKHFGSIDAIRDASVEDLTAVPGIPEGVALSIKELL